jgi:hypothetical protein
VGGVVGVAHVLHVNWGISSRVAATPLPPEELTTPFEPPPVLTGRQALFEESNEEFLVTYTLYPCFCIDTLIELNNNNDDGVS